MRASVRTGSVIRIGKCCKHGNRVSKFMMSEPIMMIGSKSHISSNKVPFICRSSSTSSLHNALTLICFSLGSGIMVPLRLQAALHEHCSMACCSDSAGSSRVSQHISPNRRKGALDTCSSSYRGWHNSCIFMTYSTGLSCMGPQFNFD